MKIKNIYAYAFSAIIILIVTFFNAYGLANIFSCICFIMSVLIFIVGYLYFISKKYNYNSLDKYSDFCDRNINASLCITVLAVSGVLLRYFYIVYTVWNERQHDIYSFEEGIGHLGYIGWIYQNNSLPDVDPRDYWQFAHPPLHHIIEALWLRIVVMLGVDESNLYEYTQIPVFVYGCISIWVMYNILKEMGLKGKAMVLSFAMVCFNPTFIIMSGSINNDMLSSMFIYMSVLYTIKWYKNPVMFNIIKIALSTGFGMMAKLSAGLTAPATAFVFIVIFISQMKQKNFKFITQYLVFLAICVPLGLWWCVRNYIKFDLPFNYITEMPLDSFQYIGDIDLLKRFTDFSQMKNIFVSWNEENIEFNPFVALLKTSVFGEFNSNLLTTSSILFDVNTVVVAVSFVSMLYVSFKKKSDTDFIMKIFWGLIFITFFGNYIVFCIQYPFTCTMNIRYVTILIMTGIYFIGSMYSQSEKSENSALEFLRYIAVISVFVMCSASAYYYTALGNLA